MEQTAYFALGCFWGAERRFWQTEGVSQTSVGYMGGTDKEMEPKKHVPLQEWLRGAPQAGMSC